MRTKLRSARLVLIYWGFRIKAFALRPPVRRAPVPAVEDSSPVFSILLVAYRTPEPWLRAAIDSVRAQSFGGWELLLGLCEIPARARARLNILAAADPRIHIHDLGANRGIAANTNLLAGRAKGAFLAVLDHDDYLEPDALQELTPLTPLNDVIYTDEDIVTRRGIPVFPLLKPDWAPESLLSYNYVCHFCVFRRGLFMDAGMFREGFEGAQDHDLFLRLSERTARIAHVSRILYHWRRHARSTSSGAGAKPAAWDAGRRAVAEHLRNTGEDAVVEPGRHPGTYEVRHLRSRDPRVEVVLVPRAGEAALQRCLDGLTRRTGYADLGIRIPDADGERNIVSLRNRAAAESAAEILLFLDEDVEAFQRDWIDRLVDQAAREPIGAVGPLLVSPRGTIAHAGFAVDEEAGLLDIHAGLPTENAGHGLRVHTVQNVSAVTAACLCVRRSVFLEAGGLDESMPYGIAEAALCLRLIARGKRIVYTPLSRALYHGAVLPGQDLRRHAPAIWEAAGRRERYFDGGPF